MRSVERNNFDSVNIVRRSAWVIWIKAIWWETRYHFHAKWLVTSDRKSKISTAFQSSQTFPKFPRIDTKDPSMQNLKHTVCEYNSWSRKQTNKQDKKNILFALFVDGHNTNYVIRITRGSKELRGHPNLTSFSASLILGSAAKRTWERD